VKEVARAVSEVARSQLQHRARDRQLLIENLTDGVQRTITQEFNEIDRLREMVEAYDPLRILARGYSITRDESGKAITKAGGIKPGQEITTYLAKGQLRSTVTETNTTNSEDEP
jgi:exodeoxyribonuclease VII large subunit